MQNIPGVPKNILKEWLKMGVEINGEFSETEMGVPQGGVISPIISNIVLEGIEDVVMLENERYNNKTDRSLKCIPVRYADDLIILGNNTESMNRAKERVQTFLEARGLKLNESKTTLVTIEDGFTFLGFNIKEFKDKRRKTKSGKRGALLIHPSKQSIQNFKDKLRTIVKSSKNDKAHVLIGKLNPVIHG